MTGTIERLADSPAARAAMATRPALIAASEANARAALFPADPGGLSVAERLEIAARVATLNEADDLASHYRGLLAEHGSAAAGDWTRMAALHRHVDLVTRTPRVATRADIEALGAAGIADADIVRLSQVIAFVNYQLRVIAGLRLIGAPA